jgi:uncharacterized protein
VKAVDTNVLVYAEIAGSPFHAKAREVLATLAEGAAPWAIPWPCIYEFLRVVTHPRIYHPPMPIDVARADVDAILRSPSLLLLSETERHREILDQTLDESGAKGNLLYDAHIVALCKEHGVSELITADRDFARFRGLRTTNPFVD